MPLELLTLLPLLTTGSLAISGAGADGQAGAGASGQRLEPGFHCARTRWNRGFISFRLARRTRAVVLMDRRTA